MAYKDTPGQRDDAAEPPAPGTPEPAGAEEAGATSTGGGASAAIARLGTRQRSETVGTAEVERPVGDGGRNGATQADGYGASHPANSASAESASAADSAAADSALSDSPPTDSSRSLPADSTPDGLATSSSAAQSPSPADRSPGGAAETSGSGESPAERTGATGTPLGAAESSEAAGPEAGTQTGVAPDMGAAAATTAPPAAPSPWARPATEAGVEPRSAGSAPAPAGQPAYPAFQGQPPGVPAYPAYPSTPSTSPWASYEPPTQPHPVAPPLAPDSAAAGQAVPGAPPVGMNGGAAGSGSPTGGLGLFSPPAQHPAPPASRSGRKWLFAGLALALVAALLGGGLGGVVGYQIAAHGGRLSVLDGPSPDGDSGAPPTAVEQVAQRTLPTVVQLRVTAGRQAGAGSGMVLSPDGLILTNNHVIEMAAGGAGQIVVLFDGGKAASAEIVGRDPSSDIALVKAHDVSGLNPITLGNSDTVRVGQQVVAIGSPLGLGGTVTTGIVSAMNRAVSVDPDQPPPTPLAPTPQASTTPGEVLDAIQTDAPINPGNSGGPLVDISGRVIGINTAIASIGGLPGEQSGSVGLGFSIPINQAKRIAQELQQTGHATTPVLKVSVQSASRPTDTNGQVGAKVVQVDPAGPGGQAGLKANDVVVKVDERTITTGDELVAAIRAHAPGDTVTLQLSDGRQVHVVLGGQPVLASK